MKKSLLAIIGSVFVLSAAQGQITQPANASFENWETIPGSIGNSYTEPIDWNTGNECSEIVNQLAVTQSSDAYDGSSSARLETLAAFGSIKLNGVVTTASMICLANGGGQEGGSTYTDMIPDSIVGYYKYTPANSDSAYSQIMFLANNDMDTISYTRVNFTETVTQWTRFSAPLTPATQGQSPEKLSLFFSSSWGDGSQGEAEVGSVFMIDAVQLIQNPQSVADFYNAEGWDIYPNPVSDNLTIKGNVGKGATLEVLDITGKQVKFEQLVSNTSVVEMNDLVAGVYLYQIQSLEGQTVRTGKLMVNP
ncbi:MAG: T9SS type A sorting domain-containing protein [Flavobacteriales bacterium]|nr:T9SS type A sorting domain-containing protein [Flavobacteriales bacterium]